jgi:hypothetical protein
LLRLYGCEYAIYATTGVLHHPPRGWKAAVRETLSGRRFCVKAASVGGLFHLSSAFVVLRVQRRPVAGDLLVCIHFVHMPERRPIAE